MFVFEAVNSGALALVDVATKTELPFDEYVVVAGRVQSSRQLTCLGGRVKRDGKRRLLVVPLTQAQDTDNAPTPSVQVLDVGEVAVNFLQGVRDCFPTLVRKNPMAEPMDDDSSDSDEEEEAHKKQKHEEDGPPSTADLEAAKAQQLMAEAVQYMSQTRVKVLATLDELFSAFQIADPTNVLTSLRNDPSVPEHCQLLCMDCPAHGIADEEAHAVMPHAFSSSTAPPEPLNFGVLFCEVATSNEKEQFLHIPVPRSPPLPVPGAQEDYVQESFQDATVLTFGAKREATAHGGGKTCEEMVKNIRMRHASGTFCTLVLPTKTWEQVTNEHKAFLPQVCDLRGELRLRRLMGNAPCGVPVELLLES